MERKRQDDEDHAQNWLLARRSLSRFTMSNTRSHGYIDPMVACPLLSRWSS